MPTFSNLPVSVDSLNLSPAMKYTYDYTTPALRENRFTEAGIIERIIQRYGEEMVLKGDILHVFNKRNHTWEPQTYKSSPLLYELWSAVTEDVIKDPFFISELCRKDDGEISLEKKKRAEERFMNVRLYSTVSKVLVGSPVGVRQKASSEFDDNNDLFFCQNGVLDLSTGGEVRDATPLDYLLHRSPAIYIPDSIHSPESAPAPWIGFLHEVFEYDDDPEDMIRFMQELFGYTLSGHISEQKIFCHYGSGANGKSKILSALRMLGGNYATYIDPDDFSKMSGGFSKAFERFGSKIENKRIAIVDDLETASIWNESLVKAVTAPYYRARAEYETSREVKNRAKLHLGLNVAPAPQAENYGILRRLCLIPYTKQFLPSQKVSNQIDAMIRDNLSGILNWSIEGFQRMWKRGEILYPESSVIALEEYRDTYFVIEDLLKTMYSIIKPDETGDPSQDEENDGFQFFHDITKDVLRQCQLQGIERAPNPEELGMLLKKLFPLSFVKQKRWCKEKGNSYRGYLLKRNFSKFEDSDIL